MICRSECSIITPWRGCICLKRTRITFVVSLFIPPSRSFSQAVVRDGLLQAALSDDLFPQDMSYFNCYYKWSSHFKHLLNYLNLLLRPPVYFSILIGLYCNCSDSCWKIRRSRCINIWGAESSLVCW